MLSRLIPKPSHFRRFLSLPLKPPHSPVTPHFTIVVPKHFSSNAGGGDNNNGDGKDPFASRAWKDFRETEEKFDAFFEEEGSESLAGVNDGGDGDGSGGRRSREERGWMQEEEQGWLQDKGLDDEDEDSIFKGIDEESAENSGGFDESNFGVGAGEDFKPWSLKGEEEEKENVFDFQEDVGHEGDFTALDVKPKVDVEQLQKEEEALTAIVKG